VLYPFVKKHRRDSDYVATEPILLLIDDYSANKDEQLWEYLVRVRTSTHS